MLIEESEKKLHKVFPFSFEFCESRLADLESNLFFVLLKKHKKGTKEWQDKYLLKIQRILPGFKIELKNNFLNIFFKKELLQKELERLLREKKKFFASYELKNKRINIEFVSANPTGPLHLGNLRGGPIGAILAKIFELRGAEVIKEYYVNDLGTQVDNFLHTIIYWLAQDDKVFPFPQQGYLGDYPKHIAQKLGINKIIKNQVQKFKDKKISLEELTNQLRDKAIHLVIKDIEKTLKNLGIFFDVVFFESSLKEKTQEILQRLADKGYVKEKQGAKWFFSKKHKELLGNRECVLVRKTGEPTYFLNDIAYHLNKIERGADLIIDVWGANHFGHKPRMISALEALGCKNKLEIIFYQPVRFKSKNKKLLMSKRKGVFTSVEDLFKLVDKDVFKAYLLEKTKNVPLDFDLAKFQKQTEKSLAYYLKYMSARIQGILSKVNEPNVKPDYSQLKKHEWNLVKRFIFLPFKIYKTHLLLEPHFIYDEAIRLAEAFHIFYEKSPIKSEKNQGLKQARFNILKGALFCLEILAEILGIDLPKKM